VLHEEVCECCISKLVGGAGATRTCVHVCACVCMCVHVRARVCVCAFASKCERQKIVCMYMILS